MSCMKNLFRDYAEAEKAADWRRWVGEITFINLDPGIRFKPIPPFGGAVARFVAEANGNSVSVYLDCYDELGIMGAPYWEACSIDGEAVRFLMHDTAGLEAALRKELLGE